MIRISCILLPLFLLYVFFSDIGCSLILQPEEVTCNTIDEGFRGCYKLGTDTTQYVSIVRGGCNELNGVGRGLLVGTGVDTGWSFSGIVDAVNSANLTVTLEGTGEVRVLTATRDSSNLILNEGGHSVLLAEYETCP